MNVLKIQNKSLDKLSIRLIKTENKKPKSFNKFAKGSRKKYKIWSPPTIKSIKNVIKNLFMVKLANWSQTKIRITYTFTK